MLASRLAIFVSLALILGVPFFLRPPSAPATTEATATLVVVTPHVPQIRYEFARGFSRWYARWYGASVAIDYRVPGGTSEIVKMLEAQYHAAARTGRFDFADPINPTAPAGTIPFDLVFGGGSYDHGRLKTGVKVASSLGSSTLPMSIPAGFERAQMDRWFGENAVGAQVLYDPGQYWVGVALSGFGIVYNTVEYARLGLPPPQTFEDLTDPRLAGWVILADPRQSGSVATTLDSILSNYGWEKGWRVIREVCANSRTFSNSSPKPPIDVSQGEAAAGLAIDFYGRGQSQAVLLPGQDPSESRVGYVDPKGATYIDADPISILRAGPNPELAKRFIEYCLTEEGQALWQLPALASVRGRGNPVGEDGERLGPEQYELRRMPVRRVMYEKYLGAMIDQANPFEIASKTTPAGWRSGIGVMMGAFAIDTAHDQRRAWRALNEARASARFPREVLGEMERLFYAFPETVMPDGSAVAFTPENFRAIREYWREPGAQAVCEVAYTGFFTTSYRRVVELGSGYFAD